MRKEYELGPKRCTVKIEDGFSLNSLYTNIKLISQATPS
jgi:hypothetical protein